MKSNAANDDMPDFLSGRSNLVDFFEQQFEDKEKGVAFEDFCEQLIHRIQDFALEIPNANISRVYEVSKTEKTKKSHDKGIDLRCENEEGEIVILCQCKFRIRTTSEIDSILSHFQGSVEALNEDAQEAKQPKQLNLLGTENLDSDRKKFSFIVLTMSGVKGILNKYEKSNFSSIPFYTKLAEENRIAFIDGENILGFLQANFRKIVGKLPTIDLHLKEPPLHSKNVYIGILSGYELKRCYGLFGEAIFFENIRLFLGEESRNKGNNGSDSVNQGILKTVRDEPDAMLARNNGVTFRALKVEKIAENRFQLIEASIVNGCQTTMCFVKGLSQNSDAPSPDKSPFVLVKIVETDDSWDIAEAANFQNEVVRIDLKLARYFRPQTVIGASVELGVYSSSTANVNTPYDILGKMTKMRSDYEETKSTFIGLFSKSPNNALATDYTELRNDLLEEFLKFDESGQRTFGSIFEMNSQFLQDFEVVSERKKKIAEKSRKSSEERKKLVDNLWKRIREKPSYRSFLNILTACVIAENNIYAVSRAIDFSELEEFLREVVNFDPAKRSKYYWECFKVFSSQTLDTKQSWDANANQLFSKVRNLGSGEGFQNLYDMALSFVENIAFTEDSD